MLSGVIAKLLSLFMLFVRFGLAGRASMLYGFAVRSRFGRPCEFVLLPDVFALCPSSSRFSKLLFRLGLAEEAADPTCDDAAEL